MCLWDTPMTYGQQLDLLFILQRVMEHFISAYVSVVDTKST